jgi:hypothetical protein
LFPFPNVPVDCCVGDEVINSGDDSVGRATRDGPEDEEAERKGKAREERWLVRRKLFLGDRRGKCRIVIVSSRLVVKV